MGWFGSLELAYKYAIVFGSLLIATLAAGFVKLFLSRRKLKKHTKAAELEAAGGREEQHELNTRELDEGDLFGIRAIESGYFGGVAQSRPNSAAGTHSSNGSINHTLVGSQLSPKVIRASPSSSVSSPTDFKRCSSPLSKHWISQPDENGSTIDSGRRNTRPVVSRSQPTTADTSGGKIIDPVVYMSLTVPPSPTDDNNPGSTTPDESTKPTFPVPPIFTKENEDYYIPSSAPKLILPEDIKGYVPRTRISRKSSYEVKRQSFSTINREINNAGDDKIQCREQPANIPAIFSITVPPRAARARRSNLIAWSEAPPTKDGETDSMNHGAGRNLDLPSKPPRVLSAVGDWGAEIFRALERALKHHEQYPGSLHTQQHQRKFSYTSSIYSVSDVAPNTFTMEYPHRQDSIDSASSWQVSMISHPQRTTSHVYGDG